MRAYRDTGIPVKLPVYGTGRIPVQERHCGTSEMLVPVEIDLENSTVPVPIPVPIERILLHPPHEGVHADGSTNYRQHSLSI